jgi:hypothetical protein
VGGQRSAEIASNYCQDEWPVKDEKDERGSGAAMIATENNSHSELERKLLSRTAKIIAQSVREPEVPRMDARCNQGFQIGQG